MEPSPLERLVKAVRELSPLSAFERFKKGESPYMLTGRGYRVDGFGMDEVYAKRIGPLLDFLFEDYFRVEMAGLSRIPNRNAALIVANHAGMWPLDALMLAYGIHKRHPKNRMARCLLEDYYMRAPFLAPMLTRLGMVRAHRENAARLLSTGHLVGVFPEGQNAAIKPYSKRYQLGRFGRGGCVRLAYESGVEIIPCAIVGSEETYPIIDNLQWVRRRLGVNVWPITLTFPALGPAGLIPLPSKWMILFGDPIDPHKSLSSADDDIGVHRLKEEVRTRIQWLIHDLLSRRESVWLG
jgi:1-acyl-sn-glycerol-3-phosphate acyltransferase